MALGVKSNWIAAASVACALLRVSCAFGQAANEPPSSTATAGSAGNSDLTRPGAPPTHTEDERGKLNPEALEAAGLRIGEIIIDNGDVFDPKIPQENHAIFRIANRLHIETRPGVI